MTKAAIMKKTVLCGLLVSVCVMAGSAQSEDLKAYYEKQKAEIAPTFTAPAIGAEITITLVDGQAHTGVIKQLTEIGVQILSDETYVTCKKRELSEASCVQLFAEDYAHAMAIKRTRAYKRGHAERVHLNTHKGSLSVKSSTQRASDLSQDKTEKTKESGGSMETESTAFSRVNRLTMSIVNRTTHPDTYTLVWYFFVQEIGTDNVAIHNSESEEIRMEGRQKITRKVMSKPYDSSKVTKSWISCPTCSTSDTKTTGLEEQGYLVLLMCGDEILDKKASSKRYLNVDWLKICK